MDQEEAAAAAAAAAAAHAANAPLYAPDGSLIIGRVENEATMGGGDGETILGFSDLGDEQEGVKKPTRSIDTLHPGKMVASKGKVQHGHNTPQEGSPKEGSQTRPRQQQERGAAQQHRRRQAQRPAWI